ncbi:hypothetical protein [Cellulomonas sp. NS3]|uniref:hypothetical protein n=1 Tax=Cellulomonas sp. NS3 TaxID=2973977 RepID=UPI00216386FB|nr:hypothetical protein [Cellulomonas sp. NS3]
MSSLVLTSPNAIREATSTPGTSWDSIDMSWQDLDVAMRKTRHAHRRLGNQLASDHHSLYESAYEMEFRATNRMSVPEILDEIAATFGLPWVDLSRIVAVSVPGIRKWRHAGGVTAENRSSIARVLAFMRVLRVRLAIPEPAAWMNIRLVDGYTVTIRHLLSAANVSTLLDFAAGNIRAEDLLDGIDPEWRARWVSADEVVVFDDGMPAIVRRS